MTDLQRAVIIIQTYKNKETPDPATIQKDLGWFDVTLNKIEWLIEAKCYWTLDWPRKRRKLARELQLLYFFNNHVIETRRDYWTMSQIIEMNNWNEYGNEISDRQIRTYIKDIKDSGFPLVTRRGRNKTYRYSSGYKFKHKINL